MKRLLNLLKRKDFAALFWAQVSGVINDNLIRTALTALIAAHILTLHGQDSKLVLMIIGLYMLPFFIFSILAGQIGDKYDKAKVTRIIKFTEIFTVIIAALGFYLNSSAILFCAVFIMGTQSAFFGPIKYALMTQILNKTEFIDGNALLESSRYLAILLGTVTGLTFAAPKFNLTVIFSIMFIFAVAGYLVTRMLAPLTPLAETLKITPNIFKSTWKNLSRANQSKKLFLAILAINWFWVVAAILLSQLNSVTNSILNLAPEVYTFLIAVFCISVGIGCLACYRLVKAEISIKYVPLTTVGMSLSLLLIAFILA
ncbi:MAG: MFS transporter, partial [Elusimicrobiaceae bacterium]|nr:MFS transporter [Elusimicrobiaceae bacterium]